MKAYSETASAATPVTITMDRDTFYRWLGELQGIADPGTTPCDPPNFHIEQHDDVDNPCYEIDGYLDTAEGTVIVRHKIGGMVDVTIRTEKPSKQLMKTVHWMLGEEGEAA